MLKRLHDLAHLWAHRAHRAHMPLELSYLATATLGAHEIAVIVTGALFFVTLALWLEELSH